MRTGTIAIDRARPDANLVPIGCQISKYEQRPEVKGLWPIGTVVPRVGIMQCNDTLLQGTYSRLLKPFLEACGIHGAIHAAR